MEDEKKQKKRTEKVYSEEALNIADSILPPELWKEVKHFSRIQMALYIYELRKEAYKLGRESEKNDGEHG